MNSIKTQWQRSFIACLPAALCLATIAIAQQPSAEQEFFDAIRQGKADRANELLLKHGANVNAKDNNGKTPLANALEYKQDALAAFLRERGGKQ